MLIDEKPATSFGQIAISLLLAAVLGISGWTLITVIEVRSSNAVLVNDLSHVKSDVVRLTTEMRQDLKAKADLREMHDIEKRMDSMEARIVRTWDRINREHLNARENSVK